MAQAFNSVTEFIQDNLTSIEDGNFLILSHSKINGKKAVWHFLTVIGIDGEVLNINLHNDLKEQISDDNLTVKLSFGQYGQLKASNGATVKSGWISPISN